MFDRFEYLCALVETDRQQGYGYLGRFAWRINELGEYDIGQIVDQELEQAGATWPLLQAGAFGRDHAQLVAAKKRLDERIASHRSWG
jgi:hypothetical protein